MVSYSFAENVPQEIASAAGLGLADSAIVEDLVRVWREKLHRNLVREMYYEMHRKPMDLGIAVPPKLRNLRQVMGWPAKAVDMLATRSQFDGFTSKDDAATMALQKTVLANGMKRAYRQAATSEVMHSCAFATVTAGDAARHEPRALVRFYPATAAAAIWDSHANRIKAGLVVADRDMRPGPREGEPTRVMVFTDEAVISIDRAAHGGWVALYQAHSMGRTLMVPMAYRASLSRPFGKSAISRAVMDLTDSAMRAAVRSEIAGEFISSPQKYLMGAKKGAVPADSMWDAYIGSVFCVGPDPVTGAVPQYGQLPQGSMQPHVDYMRSLAARFSGETNVPISSLGVISDNPSSAEAIYAAKEDLVITAQNLNEDNGEALRDIAFMALAIERGTDYWTELEANENVQAKFRNPARPSLVSQADAMCKIAQSFPWMAESDVALEELGFGDDQIMRLRSDRRRSQSNERSIAFLMGRGGNGAAQESGAGTVQPGALPAAAGSD